MGARGARFSFAGTLAVTTYPLLEANQAWTDFREDGYPARKLFPSRASEGVYNAMKSLLVRRGHFDDRDSLAINECVNQDLAKRHSLAEYYCPFRNCDAPNGCQIPPVWLTVLSQQGYWPLAVGYPGKDADPPLPAWTSEDGQSDVFAGPLPRLWRFLFAMITGALTGYFFFALAPFSQLGKQREFAEFGVWPEEEDWLARFCYVSISSLALLAFYIVYVAPLFSLKLSVPWLWAAAGVFLILFVGGCLFPLFKLRVKAFSGTYTINKADYWHCAIVAMGVLYLMILVWDLIRLFFKAGSLHYEKFFFAYRSLHLGSGVSPTAPLLFLILGFFFWGRVHLKRVALAHDRIPWLPTLGKAPKQIEKSAAESLDEIRLRLEELVSAPLSQYWRMLGTVLLFCGVWYYLPSPLASFEYPPYDGLIIFSLATLYALLFLTWARIMLIWDKLRLFLESLERHPIRFAFSALPKEETWSPIFRASAGRRSYSTEIRVREGLRIMNKYEGTRELEVVDKYLTKFENSTVGCDDRTAGIVGRSYRTARPFDESG